jgi:hypothetical protein
MKFVLSTLKMGERLKGRVVEILPDGEIIINFGGDLLRVHNETSKTLALGSSVTLVVTAVRPLRFHLLPDHDELRRKGRIDVSI